MRTMRLVPFLLVVAVVAVYVIWALWFRGPDALMPWEWSEIPY